MLILPVALTGLDTRDNVLLSTFVQRPDADFLKAVQNSHSLKRDVEWRDSVLRPCATQSRKRACIVQQADQRAKESEECRSCGNGYGPFKSWRVLAYGDQILFNGACGNCGFNSGGNKCSLREEGAELAGWVKAYLKKANPLHQLVREKVPVRIRTRLIVRMLANPHVFWESQKKSRGSATPVAKRTRPSTSKTEKKGKSTKDESSDEEASEEESEDDASNAGSSGTKGKQVVKGKAKAKTKAKWKVKAKKYFENDLLRSPLNDRGVVDKTDFSRAAEAYDAIPEMIEALEEAREALKGRLVDTGQLAEDEDEKEEESDDDPFAAYIKKRKRA